MKRIKLKTLMGPVILGMIVTVASAYPISPRPLRLLVEESEFILVAHVRDIQEVKRKKDDHFGGHLAMLTVREVLKGNLGDTIVQVAFNKYMICPAPPFFEKGTDALVFLDKRNNTYSVHALSYGVKTLTKLEIEIYKTRIHEMQEIMSMTDADQKFVVTAEWLVKCAENPATREEGVYELSPKSNFMSYYDRNDKMPFEFTLSDSQKLRLKDALLSTPSMSYSDIGLVDLIYPRYSEQVFTYLVEQLHGHQEDQWWFAGACMNRINLFKSTEHTKELAAEYDNVLFGDRSKKEDQKKIIHDFISEIEKL